LDQLIDSFVDGLPVFSLIEKDQQRACDRVDFDAIDAEQTLELGMYP
jgi:hypothetical protein